MANRGYTCTVQSPEKTGRIDTESLDIEMLWAECGTPAPGERSTLDLPLALPVLP